MLRWRRACFWRSWNDSLRWRRIKLPVRFDRTPPCAVRRPPGLSTADGSLFVAAILGGEVGPGRSATSLITVRTLGQVSSCLLPWQQALLVLGAGSPKGMLAAVGRRVGGRSL
jgi:hypothetical protein